MAPLEGAFGQGDLDAKLDVPEAYVEAFTTSMPVRYRVLFDPRAICRHAAIAYARQGRLAQVGTFRAMPDGTAALCITADDRPGLLSLMAAVLASHRMTVLTALLFSRTTGISGAGTREAVDLFWVRRDGTGDARPIDGETATSMARELSGLLSGSLSVNDIAPPESVDSIADASSSTVRFEEKDDEGSAVLTIETHDAPSLLLLLAETLFRQRAQIVRSLVRTVEGRVHNRFDLVEFDGAPLTSRRRADIRAAVAAALAQREIRGPVSG